MTPRSELRDALISRLSEAAAWARENDDGEGPLPLVEAGPGWEVDDLLGFDGYEAICASDGRAKALEDLSERITEALEVVEAYHDGDSGSGEARSLHCAVDWARRFAALSFLYCLDPVLWDWVDEVVSAQFEGAWLPFGEPLRLFRKLVERGAADFESLSGRRILWEVVNASVADDPGRVEVLVGLLGPKCGYDEVAVRAIRLRMTLVNLMREARPPVAKPSDEKPRGGLNLATLAAFKNQPGPPRLKGCPGCWYPAQANLHRDVKLGVWATDLSGTHELDEACRPLLMDALLELPGAGEREDAAHRPLLRAVLGKCHWYLGAFSDAARLFREAATTSEPDALFVFSDEARRIAEGTTPLDLADEHEFGMFVQRAKGEGRRALLSACASAHSLAGDLDVAVQVLEDVVAEFPRARGFRRRIAELHRRRSDYMAAYKRLAEEVELEPGDEPEPESGGQAELATSIALALGGLLDSSRQAEEKLRREFDADEEGQKLLASAHEALFSPAFGSMPQALRETWIYGAWTLWARRTAPPWVPIMAFGKVVEAGIKDRLLEPFRKRVAGDAALRELAEQASVGPHGDMSTKLGRCFKGDTGDPEALSVGELSKLCRKPATHGIQARFAAWVATALPAFGPGKVELLRLDRIKDLRNPSAHELRTFSLAQASEMYELCRRVLSVLYQPQEVRRG